METRNPRQLLRDVVRVLSVANYGAPKADFLGEAKRILEAAEERGITLRLMGAAAIRMRSPSSVRFHEEVLERSLSDLDFMTYSRHTREVRKLLQDLNYVWDEVVARVSQYRDIFHDTVNKRICDVFYDKLHMCHTIEFKDRLKIDYPTIPVADLLLEKLQIVKLNEKDVKDLIVLFKGHPVAETDENAVNCKYVAGLLANDWGFYYTVTTNLKRLRDDLILTYDIPQDDVERIRVRIDELLEAIEKTPKSLKWKMRAKVGTKQKWYRDVEEVIR
jgi:hypothetical protein